MAAQCAIRQLRQSGRRARTGAGHRPGSEWTSSRPSSPRASTTWERGSSSWSPSRLERTATRLSPSIVSPSARRPPTGPTLFVYLRFSTAPDDVQDAAVEALVSPGGPSCGSTYQTSTRWQESFPVGDRHGRGGRGDGHQPVRPARRRGEQDRDAQAHRRRREDWALPAETPIVADGSLRLFTDAFNAELLSALADDASPAAWIRAQLERLKAGDYLALLAYVPMTGPHEQALTRMRAAVRDRRHVATCVGFGPRFLHSTGQAYKGGPNSGVFLQITCEDAADLPVPGARYSFGVVKAAQARGDFQVLVDRRRRALRVHLGRDVTAGLATLEQIVVEADARLSRPRQPQLLLQDPKCRLDSSVSDAWAPTWRVA